MELLAGVTRVSVGAYQHRTSIQISTSPDGDLNVEVRQYRQFATAREFCRDSCYNITLAGLNRTSACRLIETSHPAAAYGSSTRPKNSSLSTCSSDHDLPI